MPDPRPPRFTGTLVDPWRGGALLKLVSLLGDRAKLAESLRASVGISDADVPHVLAVLDAFGAEHQAWRDRANAVSSPRNAVDETARQVPPSGTTAGDDLSTTEVADMIGVTTRERVGQLIRAGELGSPRKVGGAYVVARGDVDAYLARRDRADAA